MQTKVFITQPSEHYELIDSGEGEKLERYGSVLVSRPDPQALWKKTNPKKWLQAGAVFVREAGEGSWKLSNGIPAEWNISFGGFTFLIRPAAFKHTGIFPEQLDNWKWISDTVAKARQKGRAVKVLNLFGYTGGATLAAAAAGAEVAHVDGSKSSVTWAHENARLSGLDEKPIRWIVDDAVSFLKREIRRGNTYDGIIMDPPTFGRGPKGEVWKLEDNFIDLLELCKKAFTLDPLFLLVNGYASGYSQIAYGNNITELMKDWKGEVEIGELTIEESGSHRLLPSGIVARWRAS